MGSVYLLGDWEKENAYKIGVTRGSIENRIKKLQTGNSGEIYMVTHFETEYPFKMEKMLHIRYSNKRLSGEWYELSPEEVTQFKKTCEEVQATIEALKDNYFFKKELEK